VTGHELVDTVVDESVVPPSVRATRYAVAPGTAVHVAETS
jgi:hypothetical protein